MIEKKLVFISKKGIRHMLNTKVGTLGYMTHPKLVVGLGVWVGLPSLIPFYEGVVAIRGDLS